MKIKTSRMTLPARLRALRCSAFTLPEVVIGMGLAAISLVSVYGGLAYGFTAVQLLRENMRATQVMLQKLETIRVYSWEQITGTAIMPNGANWGTIPATWNAPYDLQLINGNWHSANSNFFTGTTTIEVPDLGGLSYQNDLRLVTVQVTWTSTTGMPRTRKMATLTGKQGLHDYVY